MKQNELKLPDSFCVAPWIHAHVAANGKRRLCCIATEVPPEFSNLKYSEFKNSEYMKNIRKMMLAGVVPNECIKCENVNRIDVYRDRLNADFANYIEPILKLTSDDGFSKMSLKYIDYRSNLCNLSCRTCDPGSSSTWQKKINSAENINVGKDLFPYYAGNSDSSIWKKFNQEYAVEMLDLLRDNKIDRIYFAGGEPVIEPNHIPTLEKILSLGQSSDISLYYNTNLSFSENIFDRWTSVLKNFRNVHIFVSIDGYGKICEYIREGIAFEVLRNNISHLKLKFNFEIRLDITLTSLNLFFLEDFAKFAIAQNIQVMSKLMFFGERSFSLLRTEAIPVQIKEKIIERWDLFYSKLSESEKELVSNLNATIHLFQKNCQDAPEVYNKHFKGLLLFESMFPKKNKFLDLLQEDTLGCQWSEMLKKYSMLELGS